MTTAYCLKCKKKVEMINPQKTTIKAKGNKTRPALTDICQACGTKIFRILPSGESHDES